MSEPIVIGPSFFFLLRFYLFILERESERGAGVAEREGKRILSRLCAEHGAWEERGLDLMTSRSQPEPKSKSQMLNLEPPRHPCPSF